MFKTISPVFSPVFGGSGITPVVYLLRDDFPVALGPPIVSPRACNPGPGTMTATNVNGWSIASGNLQSEGGVSSILATQQFVRSAGLCSKSISVQRRSVGDSPNYEFGYRENAVQSPARGSFYIASDFNIYIYHNGSSLYLQNFSANGTINSYACVQRTPGVFLLIKGTDFPTWTLMWVDNESTGNHYCNTSESATANRRYIVDSIRVSQLGGLWSTSWGIATSYSAVAAPGATALMEANGIVEATWPAIAGETYELDVRRTDNDNRWILRCSQPGSTIKLIQRQAGVETERSSSAQAFVPGTSYRIQAIPRGTTIKTYVGVAEKNSYSSASFNQSATGIKTSHAVTNFAAWPRNPSGAILSALEAV